MKVSALQPLLQASEASIRRDLQALQDAGLLKRTHGGAVLNQTAAFEPSLADKDDQFDAEKRAIARVAAGLVGPGETVLLDSGSTTFRIARELKHKRNLTVVTNAVNIAWELASGDVEVMLTGGTLRHATQSLVGPVAESTLAGLHVDKLFLATNGLDLKRGLTTPNLLEAQAKRAMIDSAREVIVVADHSKFGRITFRQFSGLDHIDCLITDASAPEKFLRALKQKKIRILVAGGTS